MEPKDESRERRVADLLARMTLREKVGQMSCVQSRIERAVKELKGFKRVALKPGETRTVTFELPAKELACWRDGKNCGWYVEDTDYRVMVGPSSRMEDLRLSAIFRVKE